MGDQRFKFISGTRSFEIRPNDGLENGKREEGNNST